jgi:glucokinase
MRKMENAIVLGADIGGSHITVKLVDIIHGGTVAGTEVRREVNSRGTVDEIIETWSGAIEECFSLSPKPVDRIGMAMPGPFDYEHGISWMKNQEKYDDLYGLDVKELLAERLCIEPGNIRFINDAESFLKGEVFDGAAAFSSKAIGLTLGTGLGSAFFNGQEVRDADLWCSDFLDSIAEDYLSTRWFTRRYFELKGELLSGVQELATKKDALATQVFNEFGQALGVFLVGATRKAGFTADVIVLGGNIANAFSLFIDPLESTLKEAGYKGKVEKAILGEQASLIGAASCWASSFSLRKEVKPVL